jgi:hypothetical protein
MDEETAAAAEAARREWETGKSNGGSCGEIVPAKSSNPA